MRFSYTQELAPELISSAGDFFSNPDGSLEWSFGEVITETITDANTTLTQGFHQAEYKLVNVFEVSDLEMDIIIYPNPADENIILDVSDMPEKGLEIFIYNLNGDLVLSRKIMELKTEISLKNLAPSDYIIRIISDRQDLQIVKLIKI